MYLMDSERTQLKSIKVHITSTEFITYVRNIFANVTTYTYSFYHIYLFFCVDYTISVSYSLGNFVCAMKFLIKYYVRKKSY